MNESEPAAQSKRSRQTRPPAPSTGAEAAGAGRLAVKPGPGAAVMLPENRLSVRLLKFLDVLFCRAYHRTDVLTPQCLPRQGPAILVCNHTSGLDPALIQSVCPRIIVWMMAREYYQMKAMKWMYDTIEAIPVDRSGRDMAATRAALRALNNGRILGVFPEGRIALTRELLPLQSGVALLAIKTRVPVYPAYLDGTQRGMDMASAIMIPNEATLTFGPPVEFDRRNTSREVLEAAMERIRQAMLKLQAGSNRHRHELPSSRRFRPLIVAADIKKRREPG